MSGTVPSTLWGLWVAHTWIPCVGDTEFCCGDVGADKTEVGQGIEEGAGHF